MNAVAENAVADNRFALALGEAVIRAWASLPQHAQHTIFEEAVAAGHRDESLREQLAVFLHDRHPRTTHGP
jgi:hypothetical protein